MMKRTPVKLSKYIKDALQLLRSTLPATIEIRQQIREDSGFVLAELPEIHRIIMNLSTNSAHAMREKGGLLEIKLEEVDLEKEGANKYRQIKPGTYLELTVSDSGHGMPPEVMQKIFDPYFTTKQTGEGTGMGLTLTHEIVRSLGGDIYVTSDPGKGTTVQVVFPTYTGEVKTEVIEPVPGEISRGNERLLLVDDEAELVESAARLLKRIGYHASGETDPCAALETLRDKPTEFDLVITDLTMPSMSGIQLAQQIKDINPDLPIILLSGFSQNTTAEKIDYSVIDDFITKPINKDDLARVIRKVLDSKKQPLS